MLLNMLLLLNMQMHHMDANYKLLTPNSNLCSLLPFKITFDTLGIYVYVCNLSVILCMINVQNRSLYAS